MYHVCLMTQIIQILLLILLIYTLFLLMVSFQNEKILKTVLELWKMDYKCLVNFLILKLNLGLNEINL